MTKAKTRRGQRREISFHPIWRRARGLRHGTAEEERVETGRSHPRAGLYATPIRMGATLPDSFEAKLKNDYERLDSARIQQGKPSWRERVVRHVLEAIPRTTALGQSHPSLCA